MCVMRVHTVYLHVLENPRKFFANYLHTFVIRNVDETNKKNDEKMCADFLKFVLYVSIPYALYNRITVRYT